MFSVFHFLFKTKNCKVHVYCTGITCTEVNDLFYVIYFDQNKRGIVARHIVQTSKLELDRFKFENKNECDSPKMFVILFYL